MRSSILSFPLMALAVACPVTASAFTPDEFDGTTLGPQWTFVDSPEVPGATQVVQDGHVQITSPLTGDHYFWIDKHAFVEQDAPTGTNWEVITKLDDFNPTVAGQQRQFTRAGMQLWQDNDHFITMSVLSSGDGLAINSQNMWQFDANPDAANDWRLMGAIDLIGYPPMPNTSLWMKIRSSPRGYQGFMSTDGANWLECLSIVKNADAPDGMLAAPKIRLFHAGGFHHGANNQGPTPAKFDFIQSAAYTGADLPYADDEFNGTALAPQWGFFAGIGEGFHGFHEGQLVLSGGVFSNLWFDREQPTYIYQNAPAATSYQLTTKVGPLVMTEIPYEKWNSYGIWLWKDQSNWILISNQRGDEQIGGVWTPNNRIEAAVKYNGGMFHDRTLDFDQTPAPGYLRIVKDGAEVEIQYSFDNIMWTSFHFDVGGTNVTRFDIGDSGHQVRLFTKRVFGDGDDGGDGEKPPMDGEFDWLHSEILPSHVADWNLY